MGFRCRLRGPALLEEGEGGGGGLSRDIGAGVDWIAGVVLGEGVELGAEVESPVSRNRRLRGSASVSKLCSIISVDVMERLIRSGIGGGGLSSAKCLSQSFIFSCVLTCCIPSRMVVVVVLSIMTQSRHLGLACEDLSR